MESISSISGRGVTEDNHWYDFDLSPLHGDSFYNQDLVEGQQFNIESYSAIIEPNILDRWDLRISGTLDPEFAQRLLSGLESRHVSFVVRNNLVSTINNLIQMMPSSLTRVSIEVRVIVNIYYNGDEEEEDVDGWRAGSINIPEDNEWHDGSTFYSSLLGGSGFVMVRLETVKIEGGKEEDRCAVCLEEFSVGLKVAKLPCSHVFHRDCVRRLLENRGTTCPMCRSALSVSC